MNWVFGAYSSVYNTAMMSETGRRERAEPQRTRASAIGRLFGRH